MEIQKKSNEVRRDKRKLKRIKENWLAQKRQKRSSDGIKSERDQKVIRSLKEFNRTKKSGKSHKGLKGVRKG